MMRVPVPLAQEEVVTPEPFIAALEANAPTIAALVRAIPPAQARRRPTPADWSVLEVINHLADEEREDFRLRLDAALHRPGIAVWNTDQRGRILSDGLFHVVSTLLLIGGALRLWFGTVPHRRRFLAGILIGAGGFNAYDGIVQHVLLHLHLVDERVCPTPERGTNSVLTCRADIPFEIAWIAIGALVLVAGLILWRTSGDEAARR